MQLFTFRIRIKASKMNTVLICTEPDLQYLF